MSLKAFGLDQYLDPFNPLGPSNPFDPSNPPKRRPIPGSTLLNYLGVEFVHIAKSYMK